MIMPKTVEFVCAGCGHEYRMSDYNLPTCRCPKCGLANVFTSMKDSRKSPLEAIKNIFS